MKKSLSLPLRVGLIGCGNISNAYFKGTAPFAKFVKIMACADLDVARAQAKAAEHGVGKACSVKELLSDSNIDIVLNLTVPQAHATVNMAAIKAGKHVYCEKPFSLTSKEGKRVLAAAAKRKVHVGCAPDTVLGGGIQTCRKLIDDGAIGRPVAAVANMLSRGPEGWHPNPDFFYKVGGGPLFDMGPYYLTSLVMLMGPVKSVTAAAKISFKERIATSKALYGRRIKVETPTHLSGLLEFANGAVATVTMSFDVWKHNLPRLEIYGTEGSISCPDPNTFGGEVLLFKNGKKEWEKIPLTHSDQTGRGLGLADMALSIVKRRPGRVSGELALHVVEIMESFQVSERRGRKIALSSKCKQPLPLKAKLPLGKLE